VITYLHQHFIQPVWPNIAADILTAIWVVSRVKLHLKNHRKWMGQHFQSIHRALPLVVRTSPPGSTESSPSSTGLPGE
jgi:hypothetical protein